MTPGYLSNYINWFSDHQNYTTRGSLMNVVLLIFKSSMGRITFSYTAGEQFLRTLTEVI